MMKEHRCIHLEKQQQLALFKTNFYLINYLQDFKLNLGMKVLTRKSFLQKLKQTPVKQTNIVRENN